MSDFTASIRELALVLGASVEERAPIGTQIEHVLDHARVVASRIRTLTAERDAANSQMRQAEEQRAEASKAHAAEAQRSADVYAERYMLLRFVEELRAASHGEVGPITPEGAVAFIRRVAIALGHQGTNIDPDRILEMVHAARVAELRLAEFAARVGKSIPELESILGNLGREALEPQVVQRPEDIAETSWRKRYTALNETHNRAALDLYAAAAALGDPIGRELTSIEDGARLLRQRVETLAAATHDGEVGDAVHNLAEGLGLEVKEQELLFALVDRITEHLGVGDDPELPEDVRQAIAFLLFTASRMANSVTYEEPITIFGGPELRARVALDQLLNRIDRGNGAPEDDQVLQELVEAVAMLEVHTGEITRWCPDDLLPPSKRRPKPEASDGTEPVTGGTAPLGSEMWPKGGPGVSSAFTEAGLPSAETVAGLEARIAADVAAGLQPLGPKAESRPSPEEAFETFRLEAMRAGLGDGSGVLFGPSSPVDRESKAPDPLDPETP
jgi:hypothetical protein